MPSNASRKQHTPSLQPRDYDLLRGLFECRMMSLAHATSLYFSGKYEAASKRIQALKAAGYVGDRRRRVGQPSLLHLTKMAFDLLTDEGRLSDFPRISPEQFAKRSRIKGSTVEHELSVMDVRVAITTAIARSASHRVDEFTIWPRLSQFTLDEHTRQECVVRPDGFLRVSETGGEENAFSFFLEVDRSNEVQRVLAEKCLCYRQFYTDGQFALRSGGAAKDYKAYGFRVLVILENAERRNNLAERLMNCKPPVKFQAWLTTRDEVLRDPLGNVWICPLDYAHATAGSVYAPEHWREGRAYVRRPERERLVEGEIVKRTLFDDAVVAARLSSQSQIRQDRR